MPRWTVSVGDDVITIERTNDGRVIIDIPARKPLAADRSAVEDLRRKLGAAIADVGDHDASR